MNDLFRGEIKKSLIEQPSIGFQSRIMNQIFQLKKVKPLISRRFWIILSVVFVVFISLLIFIVNNVQQSNELGKWIDLKKVFGRFEVLQIDQNMLTIMYLSSAVLFSVFLLLIFDRFLNKKVCK